MTSVQEQVSAGVVSSPRFAFTVLAGEFSQAVRNVATASGSDPTLPSLCGVIVTVGAGFVELAATDRYVLTVQRLEIASDDPRQSVTGEGASLLTADMVKAIGSVKAAEVRGLITITVDVHGAWSVAMPDTRIMSWPSTDDYQITKYQPLIDSWKPAEQGIDHAGFDPRYLARFAKVRDGGSSKPPRLVLHFGDKNLTRFVCGPMTGLICQWRD